MDDDGDNSTTKMPRKLWEHAQPQQTAMWRFMQQANRRHGLELESFDDLYAWSCARRGDFYGLLWEWQRWIHEGSAAGVVDEAAAMTTLPRWFAGVRLNWAENVLWTRGDDGPGSASTRRKADAATAVTEVREGGADVVDVSWADLRARVARLAAALHARGLRRGDRVVVVGAHCCHTLVVFLAAAWLGAVFSSSSTDMGVAGLLQRIVQIDPRFVFVDDAALYNARVVDLRPKIRGLVDGLRACPSFRTLVVVARFPAEPRDTSAIADTQRLESFVDAAVPPGSPAPPVVRVGFQDPLAIYYSSGTTGSPKAIVHGVGPLLMCQAKEAELHFDVRPGDVGLQYTTTGWIMYLISVSVLVVGARAVLYDGSPLVPDAAVLLRVAQQQRATNLGISPRWMTELAARRLAPRRLADLSALKTVTSTGMVLPDQLFAWFYDVGFPAHVQLANISGGTDIAGSFVLPNPLQPLHVGGCMGPALGIPIAVYDHDLADGSEGVPLPPGTPGDLVATAAFPNMPLFLWGDDETAPGPRYRAAYFARFNRVWAQGDFCLRHPLTRAVVMLGRSDGVLNPGGIRFGSADIYAVIERCFAADVTDCLCVGQRRPRDHDEAVMLFLVMRPAAHRAPDARLVDHVKATIARELTKRHVPKYVFVVPEIPVTINGKKVELPVKAIVSGRTVKPSGTLHNPASLDFFYRFQEVEHLVEPLAKL